MWKIPLNSSLPETITGEITIKVGDKITTDHIVPSGSRMKYRSNIEKYSEFVFEILDPSFHDRATKIRDRGFCNIIVGGYSYGQGSSREHAALCPMFLGVRAVIAKTIERIHKNNLINFGIIPFTFVDGLDYEWIDQGDILDILDIRHVLKSGRIATVIDKTKNKTFDVDIDLSQRERQIVLAGGTLPYSRTQSD
jgi:aconitate hydratase